MIVDNIEIFPTAQPYNASIVRASLASDPESYDGVDGLLSVAENNGQAVRSAFILRDQLYFVKEHSIYSTRDDGVNEPADWTLSEVSNTVGTPSVDGVDTRRRLGGDRRPFRTVLFDGGEPIKISQEIQPLWDTINWQYGYTALGARGYARQAHSRGRAHRAGHAAEPGAGARLSQRFPPLRRSLRTLRCTAAP